MTAIEPTTASSTPGTRLPSARGTTMATSEATPTSSAVVSTLPSAIPCTVAVTSPTRESASTEKPSSFGSCPTSTTRAMPFR